MCMRLRDNLKVIDRPGGGSASAGGGGSGCGSGGGSGCGSGGGGGCRASLAVSQRTGQKASTG